MKIGILGLWHLGSVVSAGLDELHHQVIGIDGNKETIENLKKSVAPVDEPQLNELLQKHQENGSLEFSSDLAFSLFAAVSFFDAS